jgi:GNAT superfamily N-acetyltransferase
VNQQLLGLAEDANTHTPLGDGDERIVRDRFVLWMGPGAEPHWNVAQRFRMTAGEVDEVRAEVHDLLRQRGRCACTWEVGSSATPPGLVALLCERGLVADEPDSIQTGMLLDEPPPPIDPAISVRRVETPQDHSISERIARRCFGMEDPTDEEIQRSWSGGGGSRRYLARIEGADIATATATFTPHGVVLNAGSTLPEWRGRGAYRALVRTRWDEAVAAGTPVLITQAGRMSLPILERLGFRAVCRIHVLLDEFGDAPPERKG